MSQGYTEREKYFSQKFDDLIKNADMEVESLKSKWKEEDKEDLEVEKLYKEE